MPLQNLAISTARVTRPSALLCCAALLAACQSWVDLTEKGRDVTIVTPATADNCARLGRVTARAPDHVIGLRRNPERLERELALLARNEAAQLGANAILATSEVTDGRQTFDALNCD